MQKPVYNNIEVQGGRSKESKERKSRSFDGGNGHEVSENPRIAPHYHGDETVSCRLLVVPAPRTVVLRCTTQLLSFCRILYKLEVEVAPSRSLTIFTEGRRQRQWC